MSAVLQDRQHFAIQPFDAALGAEVLGLDLSLPVGADDFARLHRAHLDHHVLVFRDQHITPGQQVAFSRRFGPLQIHALRQFQLPSDPEVLVVQGHPEPGIALPAVTVSVQARILQMAAAKLWGTGEFARLDRLTQAVPHPDASAVLKGGTEINAHCATPPFQEQELAGNPAAHFVLNSYDVQGGPSSSTVLYATEKYVQQNPRTYRALIDALDEAAKLVKDNPELAADAYLRVTKVKIDRAFLLKIITDPQIQFKVAPQNTLGLAQFLNQAGAIRNKPVSWRDYFFEHPALASGS